jgi:pyruvate dehydrogenase E1 component alpha subunit
MATQRTAQQSRGRRSGQSDGAARKRDLPDKKTAIELLEKMLLIRHFEERAQEMYMKAKVGGFLHLAVGEEATVVGTVSVMREDDYLISTYREHGQALARGTDPKNVMAELFGKETGTSRGRGGSMHLFDLGRRFMGGYGIVGGNLPLAAGLALASDYRGEDSVTLCMFGDGASNQGTFGETMNIAALWNLPIVFLVVNNQYGMGTALSRHSAVTDLSQKAECLGVPGERVDGMDVLAVRECVTDHLRQAREDRRPTLVEALTYRFRGHSAADPEVYRTKEEVQQWRERDPIAAYSKVLQEAGYLDEQGFEELDRKAIELVDEAVKFADESPAPALESLYDNVYVLGDQVQGWYSVDERTPDVHRGEDEPEVGKTGVAHELAEAGAAYAGAGDVQKRRRQGDGEGEAGSPDEAQEGSG